MDAIKGPVRTCRVFNYAFGILAIDAETRNCYLNEGGLQPFDVILCQPDEEMDGYLGIYP